MIIGQGQRQRNRGEVIKGITRDKELGQPLNNKAQTKGRESTEARRVGGGVGQREQ